MINRSLSFAVLLAASLALPQQSAGQAATKHPAPANFALQQIRIECTPAWRAETLIGRQGCVAGRVHGIRNHHGETQLSLCRAGQECAFRAVVERNSAQQIGDLSYLRGKIIAIMGDVTESRGAPRIVIKNKEQITVAPGNLPQEFDAAQQRPRGKVQHEQIPTGHW